jgi:hypothetical protein
MPQLLFRVIGCAFHSYSDSISRYQTLMMGAVAVPEASVVLNH